jgi:hypothetical protein
MATRSRSPIGGGLGASLLAILIGGGHPLAQGFREDEVQCEETVAHLADCCSDFDPHAIDCKYISGCDSDTYPVFTVAESRCIRDKSCAEVRRDGVCERTLERQGQSDGGSVPREELCR